MKTYYAYILRSEFKEESKGTLKALLEKAMRKYDGHVSVAEYVPLMFIEIPESKIKSTGSLEEELKKEFKWIESLHEAPEVHLIE